MRNQWIIITICSFIHFLTSAQGKLDSILPIRGICIAAPTPEGLQPFIDWIENELIPRKVNTLVLRVDFGYEFKSHPELIDDNALSTREIKKIVKVCKDGGITIIPQVNLLGHQSWSTKRNKLLEKYPQFNETPGIPIDTKMDWPNQYGYYCLSYCPLHPDVHNIVFEVIDEIMEVFDADAFHSGMDEVFYLGDNNCLRCQGRDKAELFAGEVTAIRNHLAQKNKSLWIWGDRLIDGRTTGVGEWEGSYNNTHRAIDMIPKDVVINDWHYERADPTAAYFALKGFKVITCPWRFPQVTLKQLRMLMEFRSTATPITKDNYQGIMHTIWSSNENAIEQFYGRQKSDNENRGGNWVEAFKTLFDEIAKLEKGG